MKLVSLGTVLLLAAMATAQQEPTHPPVGPPPHETPLPPVTGEQNPSQMPPDSDAPATPPVANADIQQQIQKKIDNDPALGQANVSVDVDDHGVTLTGTVDNEQQHQAALRAAQSLAGDRPIDDKIQIRGKA